MSEKINLSGVEAWSPSTILQPGVHTCRIHAEPALSQSSGGYPQLEMELTSTAGLGNVRDWLVIIPSTYGKVAMLLTAAGVPIPEEEFDPDDLPKMVEGKVVEVHVGEEPDNRGGRNADGTPKMRTRVQGYSPATGEPAPDTRDFAQANAGGLPEGRDDDSIPF